MGYKDNATQYGFGQLGSGYTTNGDEVTPPAGKVIVAITVVVDCKFEELVADTSNSDGGVAYFSGTDDAASGVGSQAVPTDEVFAAGLTIYGRWTKIKLTSGRIIAYVGY